MWALGLETKPLFCSMNTYKKRDVLLIQRTGPREDWGGLWHCHLSNGHAHLI